MRFSAGASRLRGLYTLVCRTLAAFILFSTACAASPSDGFVHLPLSRHSTPPHGHFLESRADALEMSVRHNHTFFSYYSIELELGTPRQPISLALDTGSDKVLVHSEDICRRRSDCPYKSIFYRNTSSSFRTNHTFFYQNYINSAKSQGEWAQDTMYLAGQNISDFNFAVANLSGNSFGIAGIGLNAESTSFLPAGTQNVSLPEQLKQNGIIQRAAYSLWLNREDVNESSILFGAIDHAKYSSGLYTMPLVKTVNQTAVTHMAVHMTGLSIYDSRGNEQPFAVCDIPVVLDSRSRYSYLPFDVIKPLYSILPVVGLEGFAESDLYAVPCNILTSDNGGIGIQIGGVDITIGFSELFVKVGASNDNATEYCVPGFLDLQSLQSLMLADPLPILGDNVLKSLYVVYDLENLEVGIAAAQTGSTLASSIQALGTGMPGTRVAKPASFSGFVDSNYGATPITLISPSTTEATRAVTITSVEYTVFNMPDEGSSTPSRTVPSVVTETVVLGAKRSVSDPALRSDAAPRSSKTTSLPGSSQLNSSTSSSSSLDSQRTSSTTSMWHTTSQPMRTASASGTAAESGKEATTDGASVTCARTLLTAFAGLIVALL